MQDTFKFIVPADLEKGKDGEWKIRGLASTQKIDQQGEVLIQKGIDLTPIDKKKGVINFDHMRGPENTIGLLDGYTRSEKGLYIEGRLFKNHTKAKAVYEIMSSLSEGDRGRVGLSVEGKILERDPLNPSVVRKCRINAVAITLNPVNTDTFADIVKSMNASNEVEFDAVEQSQDNNTDEALFTASQVMAVIQKALSVGAGSMGAPADKVGGDALQQSDMKSDCKKCGKKICKCTGKSAELEDGTVVSKIPMAVQKCKMKKMSKDVYKSNLLTVLDKLQVLYPNHSRTEIWEAVKDRLDTKFDIQKGGVGSGKKGHVTVRQRDHHWGTMRNIDTHEHSIPVHPEHYERIKNVHEGHKQNESFKDETGKEWNISKHPEGGVRLQHESSRGKFDTHVTSEHMKQLEGDHKTPKQQKPKKTFYTFENEGVTSYEAHKPNMDHNHPSFESKEEAQKYVDKYKKDFEKGLRIHNTSGKEREHKLYEDARQREDYERNKDKSRAELNQIAQESGASKHDKEKIRAQRDAAIQAGEDRDHVRPNVKGWK